MRILILLCLANFISLLSLYAEKSYLELYAFHNGLGFGSDHEEAKFLKDSGYAGVTSVGWTGSALAERIKVYEQYGLKIEGMYIGATVVPLAEDVIKPFANRNAIIYLNVQHINPEIVSSIRTTTILAASMNIKVAIYPHHLFAVETIDQAYKLVKEVDHQNIGLAFNLCHFLKNESPDDLEETIERVQSKLFGVSTSGADINGENAVAWNGLIKTLDEGDFPQARLLKALKGVGYNGIVGLQCFAIPGDKKENLKKSIATWKMLF